MYFLKSTVSLNIPEAVSQCKLSMDIPWNQILYIQIHLQKYFMLEKLFLSEFCSWKVLG